MHDHQTAAPDFGTGQKRLSIYVAGIISCAILTLISFWAVMSGAVSNANAFIIIHASACVQFFVQLLCFLRLNTQTEQSKNNVIAIVFTGVILISIIVGSLWIMANLNYYMMN